MNDGGVRAVAGGNGRLYRVSQEDADKEKRRRQELLDTNPQSWMSKQWVEDGPVYGGYLQITQDLLDWIQEGFDLQDEEHMRLNINGSLGDSPTQGKYLKIEGAWIAKHVSLKQHREDAGQRQVTKAKREAVSSDAKPSQTQMAEDEIPF
tara:strand:+ start:652 stop:1101 length:450 start_codon:yes stop_codon:yes gene_type:complete